MNTESKKGILFFIFSFIVPRSSFIVSFLCASVPLWLIFRFCQTQLVGCVLDVRGFEVRHEEMNDEQGD